MDLVVAFVFERHEKLLNAPREPPVTTKADQTPDLYSQNRAKFLKLTRKTLERRMNHGFLKFASDRIFNDKAFSESIEIDV